MLEPKLLDPKELVKLYQVLELTGQLFEGGIIYKLFAHILELHKRFQFQDELMKAILGGETRMQGEEPCEKS